MFIPPMTIEEYQELLEEVFIDLAKGKRAAEDFHTPEESAEEAYERAMKGI